MSRNDDKGITGKEVAFEAMRSSLLHLIDEYVANRGTKHEFISCITPEGTPWYWVEAMNAADLATHVLTGEGQKAR